MDAACAVDVSVAHNGQHVSVAWVDSSITFLSHQSAELVAHPIRIIGTNRWPLESHAKSHSAGGSKSNDPVAQRSLPVMTIVSRARPWRRGRTCQARPCGSGDSSGIAGGQRQRLAVPSPPLPAHGMEQAHSTMQSAAVMCARGLGHPGFRDARVGRDVSEEGVRRQCTQTYMRAACRATPSPFKSAFPATTLVHTVGKIEFPGPVNIDRTHPPPPPRMCLRTPILRRPRGPQNWEQFLISRLFGQLQGV